MIYKEGTSTPITGFYVLLDGTIKTITTIYTDMGEIIWQLVRSCYGKGYWIEDKPWLDNDTWKDNR